MKKHWFCFALAAALLTGMTVGIGAASETANLVPKEIFDAGSYKASNGLTIPYRYYLPESYKTSGKTYPVFIHMHGNGSRGTDNAKQISATGTELNTAVFRSDYDCIMIAPQCPATDMWIARDAYPGSDKFAADIADGTLERAYLNAAMELLGLFIEDNRDVIDTSRIYLSGASNGAGAAWAMAALHPHTFAAVVPMAGTGQPQGPVTEAGAAAIAARYLGTPIWTFHGDADPTLLIAGTDAPPSEKPAAPASSIPSSRAASTTFGRQLPKCPRSSTGSSRRRTRSLKTRCCPRRPCVLMSTATAR